MLSLYKLKNKFLILSIIIVSSCSIISDELSCKFSEVDCYRFNYSSIEKFRDSVTEHASKWDLKDPADALSNLTINKELSIKSSNDAEELISTNPEDIYVLARYITENQKPREWLFLAEQAFLRSWNNLNR
jgi:hypothetical protein